MKKILAFALVLMLALAMFACTKTETTQTAAEETETAATEAPAEEAATTAAEPYNLVLASQGSGTDDYVIIAVFANLFKENLPEGSNITQEAIGSGNSTTGYLLEAGSADFALGQNAISGTVGIDNRSAYTQIRALLAGKKYPISVQILNDNFASKTGYTSIRDIVENQYAAKICAEDVGSSDYVTLLYVLNALNTSIEEMEGWGCTFTFTSGSSCCDMLQDGQADIMIAHTTTTSSSIVEMCMSSDVKVYSFDDEILDYLIANGYSESTIPAGTYNDRFTTDTRSACQASSLIVRADMSDDEAYTLTKILCENMSFLADQHQMFRGLTYKEMTDTTATVVPLHPGAVKYYQEIGVLDADGNYVGEPAQ